jgi:tripartite-type tricarboxylate transporter receptor subunit TctC
VNLVVCFAAGGETDIVVRAINEKIGANLGGSTVVLNKAGAGGLVGAQYVAAARPDGITLLVLSLSHILRQASDSSSPVNVLDNFEPISRFVTQPIVIAVKGDSPFKTIDQLIKYAKENPNKLNFGSPGVGSVGHFSGEMFKSATKASLKHVPFKGSAPGVTALMGGHIDTLVTALPAFGGKVASGDLRVLASFSEKRLAEVPDVPTMVEKGYPSAVMNGWFAFVAPAKTPTDVIKKVDQAVAATLKDQTIAESLKKIGFNIAYANPTDLKAIIKNELEIFREIATREHIEMK